MGISRHPSAFATPTSLASSSLSEGGLADTRRRLRLGPTLGPGDGGDAMLVIVLTTVSGASEVGMSLDDGDADDEGGLADTRRRLRLGPTLWWSGGPALPCNKLNKIPISSRTHLHVDSYHNGVAFASAESCTACPIASSKIVFQAFLRSVSPPARP